MGLIVDTCIFIQAEKNQQTIDFTRWEAAEKIYISAITVSELLVGIHLANTEARRLKRSAFVETILAEVPVLSFTSEIARIHAELHASLLSQSKMIGAHALIIAATALTHGYSILTANQQEFSRVPGLNVFTP